MVITFLFAVLAAFGAWSLVWCVLGWLLPNIPMVLLFRCRDGQQPDSAIARHSWLNSLGLLHGPLIIVGNIPEREQKVWMQSHPNVKFITPEELPSVPELERTI